MLLIRNKDEADGERRIIGSARFAFRALGTGFAAIGRGLFGRGFEAPGREPLVGALRRPRKISACFRTCEKSYSGIVSHKVQVRRGSKFSHGRFDAPKHRVVIAHLTLSVIDRLQSCVNYPHGTPSARLLCSRNAAPLNNRYACAPGDVGRFCCSTCCSRCILQWLDIFRFICRTLQPSNQINSLDEHQVPYMLAIG